MPAEPQEITWHKHPTVAEWAVLGCHEAQLWWVGPAGETAWCMYQDGEQNPLRQGEGASFAEARQQAETALRDAEGLPS